MPKFLLLVLASFSTAATYEKTDCTEGIKARASLKFSECQDPLLPLKECYPLYPDTLRSGSQHSFLEKYGNNSHEAEYCKTRANISSCDHLTYLVQVCGAHYDACHSPEEKIEIMRMWIKQFVQGTHELYWEFAFSDNNKEIVDGDCNNILNEYFDAEEVVEITGLVNTGPNIFDNCSVDIPELNIKDDWLCSTKISNLTQKFGVLIDNNGKRIGYPAGAEKITIPSHWKYCSWKMQHSLYHEGFFGTLPYLFRCDGKCNNNDGDDQKWVGGSPRLRYVDVDEKTNETSRSIREVYPDSDNPVFGKGSISSCFWKAESAMGRGVAYYFEDDLDVDQVKMQFCKPFKTLLENCTIPMTECIEKVDIKEIVMAEMLKMMVEKTKRMMEIVTNHTQPDFLGGFSHNDCIIFGGDVAGASLQSATLGYILTAVVFVYILQSTIRP